jgi:small subunit ribosomal protein S19e
MKTKEISQVYAMNAAEYNTKLAEILKTMPEFIVPEWSLYVKSGVSRDRPPQGEDFWHKRAASILRQIYINKTVGVSRLRTRYGSRKNRGYKPEKFKKASGKMIRMMLQQAEVAGLLEKYIENSKKCGRRLTKQGKELLDSIK